MATLTRSHLTRPLTGLAVVLLVTLTAGCGGSDESDASAGSSAQVGAATPAATSEAAEPADDCAAAQPEINAGVAVTGFVTSVEIASCEQAVIATSLGTSADDVSSATGICSIAANEASSHGVASVSILSSDGTELATGTDATDCAGAK